VWSSTPPCPRWTSDCCSRSATQAWSTTLRYTSSSSRYGTVRCPYRTLLTFWSFKGRVPDPWSFHTDPDPDPALFFSGFQDAKFFLVFSMFFAYLRLHVHLLQFQDKMLPYRY
jgi:hypothetical protein